MLRRETEIINQEGAEKRGKKEKCLCSLSSHQVLAHCSPAWLEFISETIPGKPWNLKCLPLSLRPTTLFMLLLLAVSPLYPSSCWAHLFLALLPPPLFARVPPDPGNYFYKKHNTSVSKEIKIILLTV